MTEKYTEDWREAVAAAYLAGQKVEDIAKEFGCSLGQPAWCARRAGQRLRMAGAKWTRRKEREK